LSKFLPYSHQHIDEDDIREVVRTLKSDFLTQGPKVKEFEASLAEYCGSRYAVAFSSGTDALHAAYYVSGIKKDDEIIVSPNTFLATANAALYCGAKPIFVDVKEDSGNMDVALIEKAISKKTKAIIPVHYAGQPVDLKKISSIAKNNDLWLIEDACHALGAEYEGKKIGDCYYSHMTVFSFHPLKSITTGEGGAVMTNDEGAYERLMMFRHHGVTKNDLLLKNKSDDDGDWYHEMQFLGYNSRITDMQCALGLSQLKKLDRFIDRRKTIANEYNQAFEDNAYFHLPVEGDNLISAWHLYPIRLKDSFISHKKEIFKKLMNSGVGVQVHYMPVYQHPFYQDLGYRKGLCPQEERVAEREMSIPLYPGMSDKDVKFVIETIFAVFESYD